MAYLNPAIYDKKMQRIHTVSDQGFAAGKSWIRTEETEDIDLLKDDGGSI